MKNNKPLKYLLSLLYYMSFFCDNQLEECNNASESNELITLQEFFRINVIEPSNIYQHIKDNDILEIVYHNIIPKIKEKVQNCFIVPLPLSEIDIWWTDYAPNYLEKFYGGNVLDNSYLYFIIKMDKDLSLNLDEKIEIYHNLTLSESQLVYDIFREHLPYNFSWNGEVSGLMYINYLRSINSLLDMKIKNSSIYPTIEIFIEAVLEKKLDDTYKINTFNDNPYELSSDFKIIWDEINSCSSVFDHGYSLSKDNNTFIIDFTLYSIQKLEIIKKIKEIKKITFEKFILNVVDISGVLTYDEDEEIDINC
jgi:hypothetical protein